ncbi:uncharacterized protein LOC131234588 [Magnolia sinica]|uniref:uncharacterized protein LOC131234588 n=1 Tax=Magnolia sinica TaxID=86752 RepID=UPI002657EC3F|nr:uncharacterized protein LOC131234588 [Magnolia sinica]
MHKIPKFRISRLILIGNFPRADSPQNATYTRPINDDACRIRFQQRLAPILLALSPKSAFSNGFPIIPFVTYEDDVVRSVSVFRCNGAVVGEMLVEDVEVEEERHVDGSDALPEREFRRRLRFKRMPNLIQTVTRIVPNTEGFGLGEAEFQPDTSVLVQPYLPPMVAGLSLIAPYIEERVQGGTRPRVLCLGVGGGALLTFLRTQLGFFDLLGVEMDEMVLQVARRYFGLVEDEYARVCVGDGIEVIKSFARQAIHRSLVYGELAQHEVVDFCGDPEIVGKRVQLKCNLAPGDLDADLWIQWGGDFHGGEIEDRENRQCQCLDSVGAGIRLIGHFDTTCNLASDDFCNWEIRNAVMGLSNWDGSVENFNVSHNSASGDFCLGGTGNVDMVRGPQKVGCGYSLIDVIMVDLDSSNARTRLSAPPLEFIRKPVILAARLALNECGILVMNVLPTDEYFYEGLIHLFQEVFCELYEIDAGNGENFVLVASVSPISKTGSEGGSAILEKLKQVIDGKYVNCIRKIPS